MISKTYFLTTFPSGDIVKRFPSTEGAPVKHNLRRKHASSCLFATILLTCKGR